MIEIYEIGSIMMKHRRDKKHSPVRLNMWEFLFGTIGDTMVKNLSLI